MMKYRARQAVIMVIILVLGMTLGAIVTRATQPSDGCPPATEPKKFALTDALLPQELSFRKTLRSCLGDKCLTYQRKSGPPRVALLSPSTSETAQALWRFVRRYAKDGEFVIGTHAPPYGYGKTHGLTRIVRLALPLLLDGNKTGLLRQTIRWHCRVSHVAAHTALLTLDEIDLSDPRKLSDRLLSFVGVKLDRNILDRAEADFSNTVAQVLYDEILAVRRSLLLFDKGGPNTKAYVSALASELRDTHDLRDWPCQSLWVKPPGDPQLQQQDEALVRQRAPHMAPNCSAPFVQCTVARDTCEQVGTCAEDSPPKRRRVGPNK